MKLLSTTESSTLLVHFVGLHILVASVPLAYQSGKLPAGAVTQIMPILPLGHVPSSDLGLLSRVTQMGLSRLETSAPLYLTSVLQLLSIGPANYPTLLSMSLQGNHCQHWSNSFLHSFVHAPCWTRPCLLQL